MNACLYHNEATFASNGLKQLNTLHANDTFLRHWIIIKVELHSLSLTRFSVVVPSFSCASTLACGLWPGAHLFFFCFE